MASLKTVNCDDDDDDDGADNEADVKMHLKAWLVALWGSQRRIIR